MHRHAGMHMHRPSCCTSWDWYCKASTCSESCQQQLHNDVPPVSRKPVLHAGLGSTSTRLSDHLGTLNPVVILNSQWGPDSLYCCPFFCCPSNCSLHCLPCRHSLKERTEQKRKEKKRQQNKRKQMKITSMHRHAGMHMHRPSCCTSWDWYCKASTCSESCQQQLHNDVPPVSRKPVLHAGLGSTSTRLSDHLGTLSAVVILNSQWGPDSLYCCPFFCCPSNCSLHCLPCRHSLKERTEQKRKEKKRQQNKRKQMKITSMHRHAGMHMHRPSCCTSWDWYCKASTCSESCQQQLHNDVPPVSRKPVLHAGLGSTSTRLSDHLGTLSAVVILNSQWGPDSLYCCPFFCCPSNCSLHCLPCRHSLKERTEQKRKEKKRQQNKRKQMKITSMHRHAGMHMHRPSCCTSWDWYCKASTCSESCQQQLHNDVPPVSRKPVLHAGLGSTSTRLSDHLGTLSAVVILNSQWGPDSLYCCPFFCCPSNCSLHCLPCRHSLKERTEQKRKEKKRKDNKTKENK